MARKARNKYAFGVFHIQQTSNRHQLFDDDDDRNYFLEILKATQKQFAYKLYGYCLLGANSYHLILDVSGGDLSNIMKSINIRYAMYKKNADPLFRDRYKSEILPTLEDIERKLERINRKGQTPFNSYCHYNRTEPIILDWISPLVKPKPIQHSINSNGSEDPARCIRTPREARDFLELLASEGNTSADALIEDRPCRNRIIKDMRKRSTLTLKEIGEVMGGISESSVSKIINT